MTQASVSRISSWLALSGRPRRCCLSEMCETPWPLRAFMILGLLGSLLPARGPFQLPDQYPFYGDRFDFLSNAFPFKESVEGRTAVICSIVTSFARRFHVSHTSYS